MKKVYHLGGRDGPRPLFERSDASRIAPSIAPRSIRASKVSDSWSGRRVAEPGHGAQYDVSQMVMDDLGITMWRNQYYPTATADAPQDTQWNVQNPWCSRLYAAANASKVPLRRCRCLVAAGRLQVRCRTNAAGLGHLLYAVDTTD